ncbi:hypothetical protein TVNIR_3234 [Thioalkalivibrio nitratireducens DSM 14787]|uniref:Uncharacterized protein n=1 Tax=Thioalkalivibrio nitratireducens (strain DSM 14787 / UNIQEM 213 / ALEN2) TaxID=1255043 RepID=L0E0Z9_THIND|nr:hypothetical protein TVNIR_3234 [Thioalkalivibrio nitratireducens DSM 14787]
MEEAPVHPTRVPLISPSSRHSSTNSRFAAFSAAALFLRKSAIV